jgi:V/A-type H+-transporting ATPase subunit A
MMKLILEFHEQAQIALSAGKDINEILRLPVREKIGRYKYTPNDNIKQVYSEIKREIGSALSNTGGKANG